MQQRYTVKELKCPDCAAILVQNLQKIEYLKEININYDTKEILIEGIHNLSKNEVDKILKTVLSLSHCPHHDKKTKPTKKDTIITEEYHFENIDCPNCALKVENALNRCNVILDAKVNFINKKITITHHSNVEVFETICKETKKIESEAIVTKTKREKKKKNRGALILFIVSFLLFLALSIFWIVTNHHEWYVLLGFGVIYILLGYDVLLHSFHNILHGQIFDENFLMLIASVGAILIQEPIEGIMVILLYKLGEKLQDRAIDKSTKSIQGLMNLKVETATLSTGEIKDIKDIDVDDEIIVKVGEKIPLDGIIIEGSTSLDTKSLTGESFPLDVNQGDAVLSGCLNLTKVIKIKVTTKDNESTISKVVKLIEEAGNQKSKTEEFITKFARIYTPIVLGLSVIVGIIQMILGIPFVEVMNSVLVFLVVSCPCALVISVPLGFFAGIGKNSSQGILVKGGNYLEILTKADTFVFDKTGTLSEGNFVVDEIHAVGVYDYKEILKLLAHVESFSNHPIAISICHAYDGKIDSEKVTNVIELSGYGMEAMYEGKKVLVGNEELLQKRQIFYQKESCIGSVVYVVVDGQYIGNVCVVDELKPRAKETIQYLKMQNRKTILLSGDTQKVVDSVKQKLNLDEAYGKLLPADKLSKLSKLIQNKKKVVYVGDGINDTPSLKLADVGIAIGTSGSDIAKTAADIVIMNDDIGKIKEATTISKKTMHIIYQNIIFTLIIKFMVLICSMFGIFGSYGMLVGVLSDVGVCLLAVVNTLRIIQTPKERKK